MGASTEQFNAMMAVCQNNFSQDTCSSLLSDERQQLDVTINQPFWIDKTEVTNFTYNSGSGDNLPRVNLDWSQAQQHCASRGGRLPTEVEWEYAARGPDELIFPWGNSWDYRSRVNYCDTNCVSNWKDTAYNDGYPELSPAGSYPAGASWVGALDMAGNVWEWTSTIYRNYPYNANDGREDLNNSTTARTLRGGAWTWIAGEMTTTARATHIQAGPYTGYYGFRCVRDFAAGDLLRYQ
jgi:formylglycine-generating enzyme required for sulfatase activity